VPLPTTTQLGAAIRDARGLRDLTVEGLALEAGLATSTVGRIEKGKANPTWKTLTGIANVLDVDLHDLARLVAEQPPPGAKGSAPPAQ
jgi:transcriptional regulator with XRE-family HTH domain